MRDKLAIFAVAAILDFAGVNLIFNAAPRAACELAVLVVAVHALILFRRSA